MAITADDVLPRRFCATFGQKHPREPHPLWPYAHRDGYVTVQIPGNRGAVEALEAARTVVEGWLGRDGYSNLYPEASLGVEFYPRGELAVATAAFTPQPARTVEVVTRYGGVKHLAVLGGRSGIRSTGDRHFTACSGTSSWTVDEWARVADHPLLSLEQIKALPPCPRCPDMVLPGPSELTWTVDQRRAERLAAEESELGLVPR
jgi:hypothetical protein